MSMSTGVELSRLSWTTKRRSPVTSPKTSQATFSRAQIAWKRSMFSGLINRPTRSWYSAT